MGTLYGGFLRMRNISGKICRENTTAFLKEGPFWDYVEKYGRARQASDDYTAHALCMLDN